MTPLAKDISLLKSSMPSLWTTRTTLSTGHHAKLCQLQRQSRPQSQLQSQLQLQNQLQSQLQPQSQHQRQNQPLKKSGQFATSEIHGPLDSLTVLKSHPATTPFAVYSAKTTENATACLTTSTASMFSMTPLAKDISLLKSSMPSLWTTRTTLSTGHHAKLCQLQR